MNKLYQNVITIGLVITISACNQMRYSSDSSDSSDTLGIDWVTTHQTRTPVLVDKKNNAVLKIAVKVPGSSTFVVNEVAINTQGTTVLEDIKTIRVFYNGASDEFSTKQRFGSALGPDSTVIFKGKQVLAPGLNYFWVSYELAKDANLLHKVDAVCEKITVGNLEISPRLKSPPFKKRIGYGLRQHGDKGVDSYRIPGLATTNNGILIAVYDIRYNSSVDLQEDIDVGMSRSTDGGQTWEPMRVIMDMGKWGGKPQIENGIGDPAVLVDRQTNTIWVAGIWAHGHPGQRNWFASQPGLEPEETSQFMLVKSKDDGITWSQPINITKQVKDPRWHLLLQGPGKGISLHDGTLVFPAQFKDENQIPYSTIIYSKDHGETWNIGTGVRAETTEAQVVQLSDGRIMINARNNEAHDKMGVGRVVATTNDLGESWVEHPSSIVALEESTCMASIILEEFDPHGKLLLFSNPNTHTGRFNVTVKVSLDEGLTWPQENWLLLDEGHGRGYSCMTKIDEESIGVLYEGSQADLVFEKIKIEELLTP